jgi:hypothetical protein
MPYLAIFELSFPTVQIEPLRRILYDSNALLSALLIYEQKALGNLNLVTKKNGEVWQPHENISLHSLPSEHRGVQMKCGLLALVAAVTVQLAVSVNIERWSNERHTSFLGFSSRDFLEERTNDILAARIASPFALKIPVTLTVQEKVVSSSAIKSIVVISARASETIDSADGIGFYCAQHPGELLYYIPLDRSLTKEEITLGLDGPPLSRSKPHFIICVSATSR